MTFLAPLTTALVGAIGGIAVLLLHALKSRRRMVKVSTVAHWPTVNDDTQASEPFRIPRLTWLLLLHLLIMACFAIAAGRPMVSGMGSDADRVLVIDASASMRVMEPEGRERFARAIELAKERAATTLRAGGRVAVVQLDSAPKLVSGFSASPATVNAALDAMRASDEGDDVAKLPPILDGLLGEGGSEGESARVITLIDDRRAVATELGAYAIEHESVVGVGDGVVPRNLGIVRFATTRRAESPGEVRVLLELVATRDQESAVVALSLDGVELERVAISFAADRTARRILSVPVTGGVLTAQIQGTDALKSDDSASVVVTAERPLKVGLVQRMGPVVEGGAGDASWVLEETLRALPRVTVERMGMNAEFAKRVAEAGLDVVVLDGVPRNEAVELPTMQFGSGRAAAGDSAAEREMVVLWDRADALLSGLSLDGVFGVATLAAPSADARVLARSSARPLVWRVEGSGRVVAVAFSSVDTNWPLDVSFPVFVSRSIDWLAGVSERDGGRAIKAGELVEVGEERGAWVSASGERVEAQMEGGGWVRVSRAGVYRAEGGEDRAAIAVNVVDPRESSLDAGPAAEGQAGRVERGGNYSEREVWWWFLMAAAALLAVEWVVFASRSRLGA